MTKPLTFTAAAVARAIEGAQKAGMTITATSIAPDGTVTIHHLPVAPPVAPAHDPGPPEIAPEVKANWANA